MRDSMARNMRKTKQKCRKFWSRNLMGSYKLGQLSEDGRK
jgi:hypothetical protein